MQTTKGLRIGQSEKGPFYLLPKMATRHGWIAGSTGSGKSVTVKVLAEAFSDIGVPVLLTDLKGDQAGLAMNRTEDAGRAARQTVNDAPANDKIDSNGYPVRLWDVFGKDGHPLRTTVSEMGPNLLAWLLELNETQSAVLNTIFRIADEQSLLLIDYKDLRSMVQYVGDHAKQYKTDYGLISTQSIGAILRRLTIWEGQRIDTIFGEPNVQIFDLIQNTHEGRGYINILHSEKLIRMPRLYATFVLWILSELFESLSEVPDLDKPKMVLFIEHAQVLFDGMPSVLLHKVEQVTRTLQSKGIALYLVTDSTADLPNGMLGELENRVLHRLQSQTPAELRKVKATAQMLPPSPYLDIERIATAELTPGEALISFLDENGAPAVPERVRIDPPRSRHGSITKEERKQLLAASLISGKYEQIIDRESAYESLVSKIKQEQAEEQRKREENQEKSSVSNSKPKRRSKQTLWEKAASSAVTTIGREIGRTIIRGILGSLKK